MGLYTKKVKEVDPVKEVKKKGRPKKVVPVEEEKVEVEHPKEPETVPVEIEIQKSPEEPIPQTQVEKTPPPPEIVKEEPTPLKKAPRKKKEEKVEKKTVQKDEAPPTWFKKFISEIGHNPKETKKVNTDFAKETATKLWNDRVKPKTKEDGETRTLGYEQLYNQIFGR